MTVITLTPTADNDGSCHCWTCDKPASFEYLWPGCIVCHGAECGDYPDYEYWCEECAQKEVAMSKGEVILAANST